MAPPKLASRLQSLPPILHMLYPNPILGCSKGSRGLSVHMRVTGVFTGTTISPSPWLRQCPDRCTIRAGRNLPDKEFRYLRTVIVTAAVYWGFNSELLSDKSDITPPFNLPAPGRCQSLYIVLIDFAGTCVLVKQSPGPFHCGPFQLGSRRTSPNWGTPSPEVTG